jgi:hypothetical protein
MWFSGLRGAIAFSLVLNLQSHSLTAVSPETKGVLVTTTLIVVIATVFVFGGGTAPLLELLLAPGQRAQEQDVHVSKTTEFQAPCRPAPPRPAPGPAHRFLHPSMPRPSSSRGRAAGQAPLRKEDAWSYEQCEGEEAAPAPDPPAPARARARARARAAGCARRCADAPAPSPCGRARQAARAPWLRPPEASSASTSCISFRSSA